VAREEETEFGKISSKEGYEGVRLATEGETTPIPTICPINRLDGLTG
jgi:hypothetical protein